MKSALMFLLLALPFSVSAQGYEPPPADSEPPRQETAPRDKDSNSGGSGGDLGDDLGSLFEREAESLLQDLFTDIQPHMDAIGRSLGSKMEELGPVFDDLGEMMDDIRNYQAPERLANGDILIRRKPGAPPPPEMSEKFQDLTRPAPNRDPRLNPPESQAPNRDRGPSEDLPAREGLQLDL